MESISDNKVADLECLFSGSNHANCKNEGKLKPATLMRIRTIQERSIRRGDVLHSILDQVDLSNLKFHKNCVNTYTSEEHINRYLKRHPRDSNVNIEPSKSKRPRRSEPYFDWKRNCLFCGEACIDKDPKHPDK